MLLLMAVFLPDLDDEAAYRDDHRHIRSPETPCGRGRRLAGPGAAVEAAFDDAPAVVRAGLARLLPDLAGALEAEDWSTLALRHPLAVLDQAERQCAGLARPLRNEWWRRCATGVAAALPAAPEARCLPRARTACPGRGGALAGRQRDGRGAVEGGGRPLQEASCDDVRFSRGRRDVVVADNILVASGGTLVNVPAATGFTWQGNILWGSAADGTIPSGGFRRVDPLLREDSDGVHRLTAASPAVDAATLTSLALAEDADGHPRGGTRDVGADEYAALAPVRRPLTPSEVGPNAA